VQEALIRVPPREGHDRELSPSVGDPVRVEFETRTIDGVVVDTQVVGREQKRSTSTLFEVIFVWVMFEEQLGRFIRNFRDEDRRFDLLEASPVDQLAPEDRDRVVKFWLGEATTASKHRDWPHVIEPCTRVLALGDEDARCKALFLRAGAYVDVRDHRAALADWDALLALRPAHLAGVAGRARTRISLGLDAPPAAPVSSDRVRHKTYGDGKIVRRLEGDKLEIEFAAGKKTLLAKFVEPA
jgi:hypothetical protein